MKRHVLYRRWAQVAAAGAGLLVLAGLLGSFYERLDALAAFRWHAGSLFTLSLLAAFWPRHAVSIAICAPFIILGGPIAMALRPAAPHSAIAASAEQRPLKIVSFNTWDAVRNVDDIQKLLRLVDADIAVLVEVSPPKRALLEALKPIYPYQVHCAAIWQCSMALVSRVPFEAQGVLQANATMAATVWGRIPGEKGGLTVVGVHVHRPTRSPRLHWGHIRGVAEFARSVRGALVVAGDFNTPHWAASMTWLRAKTGLKEMPRVLPTWPSSPLTVPQFPIDHILVSDGVTLESVATGPASGSDHLPLIGTLRLEHALHHAPTTALRTSGSRQRLSR